MLKRVRRVLGYIKLHGEEGSKRKARQLWEIFLLAGKYRFSPMEYETFGFFRKEKDWPQMLTYLSNIEVNEKLRKPLYDERMLVILNNKLVFNRFFTAFSFPLPKLYGCLNPESGFLVEGGALRSLEDLSTWLSRTDLEEIFVKPVGGLQGSSVIVLKNIRHGRFLAHTTSGSHEWGAKELYHHLFHELPPRRFYFPGFLFEEVIKQHPALAQINASSVNTCRIVTFKTRDNDVETPFATLRCGGAGSFVDNVTSGGISSGVDIQTGIVKKGSGYAKKGTPAWFSVHPNSGAAIEGFKIPFWQEARELAMKAAAVIPGIKTVGWDVAITEKGALLVEGNSSWTPIVIQKVNQGLLTPRNVEIFSQYGLKFR